MSFEDKLHAVVIVAFVALVSAAFGTTVRDELAHAAAVAKEKTTIVASASPAPCAPH
jgi:hypothetical protein